MTVLVPLLVVLPIVGAALSVVLWRHLRLQQVLGVLVTTTATAITGAVLAHVAREGPIAVDLGGWGAPTGITLVADTFATLLLLISLVTVLAVLVYAIAQPRDDEGSSYFHPLYLVLTAGVSACFLTADLFNLFVAIEIMLSASYVLITVGGRAEQIRSGMTYVVINLLASTLLVTTIGLIYAATGSLDMADVAARLTRIDPAVADALGILLLVSLGIKAAIFPLFFWLPDAYPTAPVTVTAVFAGLLTKVGVYTIIRTQTLLFPSDGPSPLILTLAGLTMVVGVLGAIAQDDVKRILSFHIVSQIGYMLFGLGLSTSLGLAAAALFIAHQIPVKTSLFLVNGLIEARTGTAALHRLGGLLRSAPGVAALFLLAALSLAGLPPFSGFLGKLALVRAGISAEAWTITAVSLAVSVLTLFSMTKIWSGVFWGTPSTGEDAPEYDPPRTVPRMMTAATIGLVAVTLVIAVAAQPIWELSLQAGEDLADPRRYVEAVLGTGGDA